MTEQPTRPFPLTRYFVVTSLVATALIAAIMAIVTAEELRSDLITETTEHAARVARHLENDVREYFVAPLAQNGAAIDWATPENYARIDRVVDGVASSFGILEVYVFDASGRVLYCTDRTQLGTMVSADNAHFKEALGGTISTELLQPGSPMDLGSGAAPRALLETYLPVAPFETSSGNSYAGEVGAVIETYHDIGLLQEDVAWAQIRVALYALIGGLVIFVVLLWIIMRADRLIRRQTGALVDSNQRLSTLTQDLEGEVERRTQELLKKEKLASLGTLAAGLAHEVNNPMATIASCAEGLQRRLREGAAPEADQFEEYLSLIESEAFRVKKITQTLLDFSRQQPTEQTEPTDIGSLLRDTLGLWEMGLENHTVQVAIELPAEPVVADVDPTAVRQLIFNITSNAADAIEERQLGETPPAAGSIRWSVQVVNELLELSCADDGIGIATNPSDLVEPFRTTKVPGRGTGLGLALCHTLVERHGGALEIDSEGTNQGATVTIRLPLRRTPSR